MDCGQNHGQKKLGKQQLELDKAGGGSIHDCHMLLLLTHPSVVQHPHGLVSYSLLDRTCGHVDALRWYYVRTACMRAAPMQGNPPKEEGRRPPCIYASIISLHIPGGWCHGHGHGQAQLAICLSVWEDGGSLLGT